MGRLTVKFRGKNLLSFDGSGKNIAVLKSKVEAMAFDVSQFVQAQMHNLISEDPVTEIMLTCALYRILILDIYSRYVVGWLIAHRESAEFAEHLIADTLEKENIVPGTLTLHADLGTSMRSKAVAALLIDLDVAKTHSRPHVSDDNPYFEAQFKTLKYRPDFPQRFGSIEDARAHCRRFFQWYTRIGRL